MPKSAYRLDRDRMFRGPIYGAKIWLATNIYRQHVKADWWTIGKQDTLTIGINGGGLVMDEAGLCHRC